MFHVREDLYYFCQNCYFTIPHVNSVHHVTESKSSLGQRILILMPGNLNHLESLNALKWKIKECQTESYPCRLCKNCVSSIEFIL